MQGSIFQRTGARSDSWTIKYRNKVKTLRGTREDAEKFLKRMREERLTGPTGMTVAVLATWWCNDKKASRNERYAIHNHFIAHNLINDLMAYQLTYEQVITWFASIKGEPTTRNLVRSYLSRIYNRAIQAGMLPRDAINPVRYIRSVPDTRDRHVVTLTAEQTKALIMSADPDYRTMLATAVFMGLRRKELLTLALSDVDLTSATPTLRVRRINTKTAAGARKLAVPQALMPWLLTAYAEAKDLGAQTLFCNPRTGRAFDPLQDLNELVLRPAMARAGIDLPDFTWHTLRHTTASLLVANGATVEDLHVYLGHANIKVTADVYVHVQDKHMQRIAGLMSDVIG